MIELLASLGAMSGLLCALLGVFLLGSGGALAVPNRYLAAFLFLSAIDISGLVGLVLPEGVGQALGYRTPLGFLQMPVFYAYIVTLCLPDRALRWHMMAGGAIVVLSLLDMFARTGGVFPAWGLAGLHIQFYAYLGLSVATLLRFQNGLAQTRSSDQSVQLRWLWAVVIASFLAHGLVFTRTLSGWLDWPLAWAPLQLASGFAALAILCGLTLTALLRPDVFRRLEPEEVQTVTAPDKPEPDASLLSLADRAQAFIVDNGAHLEPELTLKTLARRMQVGERELSQAINHALGLHFFDLINRARIDHAKALIVDDVNRGQTLLDVAHASGFNSKSSFNTAFKKHTGQTPSAFRALVASA